MSYSDQNRNTLENFLKCKRFKPQEKDCCQQSFFDYALLKILFIYEKIDEKQVIIRLDPYSKSVTFILG